MSINKKLGERIRDLRRSNQMTQEDLAYYAELHRAYVGAIERGDKNIGLINIEKIAIALKVTISELFEGL